jgi:hypothetical protein
VLIRRGARPGGISGADRARSWPTGPEIKKWRKTAVFASAVGRSSHGRVARADDCPCDLKRLALECRLIGGLAATSRARRRGASPFGRPAAATMVASASRQDLRIQAQRPLNQCLIFRSSQSLPSGPNGSGPGAVRSSPKNGVGGSRSALWPMMDERMRSAARKTGAGAVEIVDVRHEAKAESCASAASVVNEVSQKSVDNAK